MNMAWILVLCVVVSISGFLLFVVLKEPYIFKISMRNLRRRKTYSALVILGLLIATAMISSTLTVKDSMEYLITDSTYNNLGEVDIVVSSNQYFDYSIYKTLSDNSEMKKMTDKLAPLIIMKISVKNLEKGQRESSISLIAFDKDFYSFGNFVSENGGILTDDLGKDDIFINEECAKKLHAELDNTMEITFTNFDFSLESIFSNNEFESKLKSNFSVKNIVKNEGLGRFHLGIEQGDNPIIFINLKRAQEIFGINNKINTVIISNVGDKYSGVDNSNEVKTTVSTILDAEIGYTDIGLKVEAFDYVRITSNQIFFPYSYYKLFSENKDKIKGLEGTSPILTYFVNSISAKNGKNISYSSVTGFDVEKDESFGAFTLNSTIEEYVNGKMNNDEIIINNWAAKYLNVSQGDEVTLNYLYLDRLYNLEDLTSDFTIKYIVDIKGKADDKRLMSDFPGIENIESCLDWEPPFPIDLSTITDSDTEYWQKYRGTPKAFISLNKAADLWGNDFGNLTSIKLNAKNGTTNEDFKKHVEAFLDMEIGAKEAGIIIENVKENNLEAANKMTILPGMFLAFGFFSIITGIMLVINIFIMLAEERKYELGIIRAIGLTRRRLILMFLSEGMIYAIVASILGSILGLFLGYGLIFELNNIWGDYGQNGQIAFYYEVESMFLSFSIGIIIAAITIFLVSFLISKIKIVNIIKDISEPITFKGKTKKGFAILGTFILVISTVITIFSLSSGDIEYSEKYMIQLFFPCFAIFGISLLLCVFLPRKSAFTIGGLGIFFYDIWFCLTSFNETNVPMMELYVLSGILLVFSALLIVNFNLENLSNLINHIFKRFEFSTIVKTATRYSIRKKFRSIMTIAMFSLVLFLIVALSTTIAIQNKSLDKAVEDQGGGYDIIGRTSQPVFLNLGNKIDRQKNDIDSQTLDKVEISQFKAIGEEGATCSNLNPNLPPLILGVDDNFINENRFQFRESKHNKWNDLKLNLTHNRTPIIADHNTLKWLLSGDFGSVFTVIDDYGVKSELEIIGILENSIFSGTFLMSEQNIDKLFPKSASYRYFLFEVKGNEDNDVIAEKLEIELDSLSIDTKSVKETVEKKIALEQSYTSLFQLYLTIGLIVGIASLGIISARSVIERKWEIGILRALGFKRRTVLKLFIIENSYISLIGILIGTVIGIISTYISFASFGRGYEFTLPIGSILFIIIFVYLVSLLCTILPAIRASRLNISETLRRIE